ncbi:MAG: hypothetical protein ABI461_06000 [Polyangiaceae bacterium]
MQYATSEGEQNVKSSAQAESSTTIYPYEPPHQLAPNLWQIKGSLSVPVLPRYMTIYRLSDGTLLLYSVIAMHEEGMRELEKLGTPSVMIMPHDRHQMDAPFYKRRYPSLRVIAPDPSHTRNVTIDADLSELNTLGIRAYSLPGTTYHEAVLELPVEGGIALCTTELLANMPKRGILGWLAKIVGPPGGGFGVNRVVRWREVRDRKKLRVWLTELADRVDIRLISFGHTPPLREHIADELGRAAERA